MFVYIWNNFATPTMSSYTFIFHFRTLLPVLHTHDIAYKPLSNRSSTEKLKNCTKAACFYTRLDAIIKQTLPSSDVFRGYCRLASAGLTAFFFLCTALAIHIRRRLVNLRTELFFLFMLKGPMTKKVDKLFQAGVPFSWQPPP